MYWYNPTTRTSERGTLHRRASHADAGRHSGLRTVHKALLRAAPLGDGDRASFGVGGTGESLEATGISASSAVGELLRRTRVSPFERRTVYVPRVGRARERS